MSDNNIKELSKSPFDKHELYDKFYTKIVDIIKDNNEEDIYDKLNQLCNKTKNAIDNHVIGNVLVNLKQPEVAELFFDKAKQLGYILNESLQLPEILSKKYQMVIGVDVMQDPNYIENIKVFADQLTGYDKNDVINTLFSLRDNKDVDINITYELIGKQLNYNYNMFSNDSGIITDIKIQDNNVLISYDNNTSDLISKEEYNNLINNGTVNIKEIIVTVKPDVLVEENLDVETSQEDKTNVLKYNISIDNLQDDILNMAKLFFDNDVLVEDTVVYDKDALSFTFDTDGVDMSAYWSFRNELERALDVAGIKYIKNENSIDIMINNINESGSFNLELDIANDLLPQVKKQKQEKGIFTVKDLEQIILQNGGNLEMLDNVVSELVNLDFEFDIDIDESIDIKTTFKEPAIGKFVKILNDDKIGQIKEMKGNNITVEMGDGSMKKTTLNSVLVLEKIDNENMRTTTDIEKDVFLFLNNLRESGVTNMFGATPYILDEFTQLDKNEASKLLSLWMSNFNDEGNYDEINESNINEDHLTTKEDKIEYLSFHTSKEKEIFSQMSDEVIDTLYLEIEHRNKIAENLNGKDFKLFESLRSVEVTFSDGDIITTAMAQHLTDQEIYDYYEIGKEFNLGIVEDNIQSVVDIKILESHISESFKQHFGYDNSDAPWVLYDSVEAPEKVQYNHVGVKNLVMQDNFLRYMYEEMMSGNYYEDMEMMYNKYIKTDEDYLHKLKTYEKFAIYQIKEAINKNEIGSKIVSTCSDIDLELTDDDFIDLVDILPKVQQLKEQYKQNYILLTNECKSNIKNTFEDLDIIDLLNQFKDTKMSQKELEDDNVLETLKQFNKDSLNQFNDVLSQLKESLTTQNSSHLGLITTCLILK